MSSINSERSMAVSNKYVANINRLLKDIKSDIMADFIWADYKCLVITTNKVAATLNLNTIESYIKNINAIDFNKVMSSKFL